MTEYLIMESRTGDADWAPNLASSLSGAGHGVTLFLVQNGVLAARDGAAGSAIGDAIGAGVEVVADEFSLRERGIGASRMKSGVSPARLDRVIDAMCAGHRVIWH